MAVWVAGFEGGGDPAERVWVVPEEPTRKMAQERVPRDVFIEHEFYYTDTKNRGKKKIHKARQVCV
jgi:hypothetical protein